MTFNDYTVSTKSAAIPAGAYPSLIAGFVAMGKQPNPFAPNKPPQLRFVLCYRPALPDGNDSYWCKTYSAAWGAKAGFFKDCSMLFNAEEVKTGQLSPLALIGRPAQLLFTAVRDEAGQEKTILAAVGSLTKSAANAEVVKRLREGGTFQCDASKGEKPPLEFLNQLPKWLIEQMDSAATVQVPVSAPVNQWTAPAVSPTVAMMQQTTTNTAQPMKAVEPLNDSLDDINW